MSEIDDLLDGERPSLNARIVGAFESENARALMFLRCNGSGILQVQAVPDAGDFVADQIQTAGVLVASGPQILTGLSGDATLPLIEVHDAASAGDASASTLKWIQAVNAPLPAPVSVVSGLVLKPVAVVLAAATIISALASASIVRAAGLSA